MQCNAIATDLPTNSFAAGQLMDSLLSKTTAATHSNGKGLSLYTVTCCSPLCMFKPGRFKETKKADFPNWPGGPGPPPGRRGRCNAEQRTPSSPSGPFDSRLDGRNPSQLSCHQHVTARRRNFPNIYMTWHAIQVYPHTLYHKSTVAMQTQQRKKEKKQKQQKKQSQKEKIRNIHPGSPRNYW